MSSAPITRTAEDPAPDPRRTATPDAASDAFPRGLADSARDLADGRTTSTALVTAALARIEASRSGL
ncbi:amidase, partial [Streptomyces sp. OfavH-34-F]|nr:amidase [Streptomyces sp. OfavH-34-F]